MNTRQIGGLMMIVASLFLISRNYIGDWLDGGGSVFGPTLTINVEEEISFAKGIVPRLPESLKGDAKPLGQSMIDTAESYKDADLSAVLKEDVMTAWREKGTEALGAARWLEWVDYLQDFQKRFETLEEANALPDSYNTIELLRAWGNGLTQ